MALEKQCQLVITASPVLCLLASRALVLCREGPFSEAECSASEWDWRKKSRLPTSHSRTLTRRTSLFCVWLRDRHMPATPQRFGLWYRGQQAHTVLPGPCLASQDVWQAW